MNQLQHYLLMLIDKQCIDVDDYISFDKIIAELKPIYQQENIVLDEKEITAALGEMVDAGDLEYTQKSYHMTARGLIYARSYPIITDLLNDKGEELNQSYKTSMLFLWIGVILSILFSFILLIVK
jgi:hypothetical protein